MTRRLNGNTANVDDARRDAGVSAAREIVRTLGGAASHVLNAFACVAPALASNAALVVAGREAGRGVSAWHIAGAA
ncbi:MULTISPECIES: hypothetical protein [Burkholderia cepacia complex]|uniref:hypothetical protein n=1 Tax=Burkholderia cepacia complex TaxID=87882 RepID=UPI00080B5830|nr:hypothetical protein [Burkholderia stabilis]GAU04179.1 hypothetical protein BSLA_02f1623 [Burkholderia stabilis]